jgi:hypothetical protein
MRFLTMDRAYQTNVTTIGGLSSNGQPRPQRDAAAEEAVYFSKSCARRGLISDGSGNRFEYAFLDNGQIVSNDCHYDWRPG